MSSENLSLLGLYLEGLLSFLSPCVLPMIPLYIGYLTADIRPSDSPAGKRMHTVFLTFFFILGICTVFFLAALGSGKLHDFFTEYEITVTMIGGFLLVCLGLYSLHVIDIPFLNNERHISLKSGKMTYLRAWLMGFFFSFAWSPCIGPLLASALTISTQASSSFMSFAYIMSYCLGFITIFILIGLFTEEVLSLLKKHRNIVKYTGVIGGCVVLCMGIYMCVKGFGKVNAMERKTLAEQSTPASVESEEMPDIEKYDFTLENGKGEKVSLSDFKGKTVLLNFFGTWCGYCNEELPDLEEVNQEDQDVKVLLIAAPGLNGEGDREYIENYMAAAGYDMEILYDDRYEVTNRYGIQGYPTTYFIQPDGNFMGYRPGYTDKEMLQQLIQAAKK